MDRRYKRNSGKKIAPDGNEPIRMEAARGGLCPGAKGLLKEEEKSIVQFCIFNLKIIYNSEILLLP